MYTLIGFVISFYVIWKVFPQSRFGKIIIWFLRIGTIFLSVMILSQIGLLIYDKAPLSSEGWNNVRYNLFHDLGWQSAVWFLSMKAVQATVKKNKGRFR